jgi:hypothetical protein
MSSRVSIQKWRDGWTWTEGRAMQSPADDLALPIIERHGVAVAILMEEGKHNPFFETLLEHTPSKVGEVNDDRNHNSQSDAPLARTTLLLPLLRLLYHSPHVHKASSGGAARSHRDLR